MNNPQPTTPTGYTPEPFSRIGSKNELLKSANEMLTTEIHRLTEENAELLEALKTFVGLCSSKEGMGGHAPIGAFFVAADKARAAIAEAERMKS